MVETQANSPAVLSISCVTFDSEPKVLSSTLKSLADSCEFAIQKGSLSHVYLYLIDNGPDDKNLQLVKELKERFFSAFSQIFIKTGHGNIGYGRGHNLAILGHNLKSDYHLILNPDVLLDLDCIHVGLSFLNMNTGVGLLAPDAFFPDGNRQFIAKRQPKFKCLLARVLQKQWLNEKLKKDLDLYEYRDLIPASKPLSIELASGCFMLCRSASLQSISGFDSDFFMYFEDFDLSQRISKKGQLFHHPEMKVVHYGGNASRKSFKHIIFFVLSFLKYRAKYR